MAVFTARVAGRFAHAAAALGDGEVCALSRRGCYLRFPGGRYACVGGATLGRGPLNVLVERYETPALGARLGLSVDQASLWEPPHGRLALDRDAIRRKASARRHAAEGLGCLLAGTHNALSVHAQPALEAFDRWLVGHALEEEVSELIGLGSGLMPPGDAYLGGALVALHAFERAAQARSLWSWIEPRLSRTSALSAAHLAAAAAGETHEALHDILAGSLELERLDAEDRAPAGTRWPA